MAFNDVTSTPKLVKICQVIKKLKSGGMHVAFSIHVETFFCQKEKRQMIQRKVARNFQKWKKKSGELYHHVETTEDIYCEREGNNEVTKSICYVPLHLPFFFSASIR
jgi:hypothetical protein